MLAQNFKTPAELRMTDADFAAHLRFLGMLEREEISHKNILFFKGDGFNMALAWAPNPKCGTVGCIYGWTQWMQGKTVDRIPGALPEARHDLYCPRPPIRRHEITTAQAAIALRNYLTFGEARWSEAIAS